jgi:hypothetical protein
MVVTEIKAKIDLMWLLISETEGKKWGEKEV